MDYSVNIKGMYVRNFRKVYHPEGEKHYADVTQ